MMRYVLRAKVDLPGGRAWGGVEQRLGESLGDWGAFWFLWDRGTWFMVTIEAPFLGEAISMCIARMEVFERVKVLLVQLVGELPSHYVDDVKRRAWLVSKNEMWSAGAAEGLAFHEGPSVRELSERGAW